MMLKTIKITTAAITITTTTTAIIILIIIVIIIIIYKQNVYTQTRICLRKWDA